MGRGLITVVLIFVVMGLFIWGRGCKTIETLTLKKGLSGRFVVVTFIFFVTIFVATLLPH